MVISGQSAGIERCRWGSLFEIGSSDRGKREQLANASKAIWMLNRDLTQ
jgi:hypothetical protein